MTLPACLRSSSCLIVVVLLASCSGGGGGAPGGTGAASLLRIEVQGAAAPLWQLQAGMPAPAPSCAAGIVLNAAVTFTFGGPVDAASLPAGGSATGSINVTAFVGGLAVAARGVFSVEDDPGLPAGNRRRVVFRPDLPADPAQPTLAGLAQAVRYSVFVPRGGGATPVVTVGGVPLQTEALTCFDTCDGTGGGTCFADVAPGPPAVLASLPDSSDPAPPPVAAGSIAGNAVSLTISEALAPETVTAGSVSLVRTDIGAPIPTTVGFVQASADPALGATSTITVTAPGPLVGGVTYEIVVSPQVTDLGGNPLLLQPGTPGARRFFGTIAVPVCAQAPIVEDFGSTSHRDVVTPPLRWDGTGALQAAFPGDVVGDGSGGVVFLSAAGSPHVIDTATFTAPGFQDGVWNVTSFTLEANATLLLSGPWPLHIKALGDPLSGNPGDVVIGDGAAVLGNAPTPSNSADPEAGPWQGGANNSTPAPFGGPAGASRVVEGGRGGPGGGAGGRASQAGDPARTLQAEQGLGPFVAGVPGDDPSDPFFGGGEGGRGADETLGGAPGGAGGGAGGSAYGAGGTALALGGANAPAGCLAPAGIPVVPPAQGTGPVAGFTPPVSEVRGGSGGGGGGDDFDLAIPTLNLDDQGSGGGGGGGGLRIGAVGGITVGMGARIEMNGSPGHASIVFNPGAGGSGSGGMIWMQSFSQISIDPTANLQVSGGGCPATPAGPLIYRCFAAPGLGGQGLYQFEDADGSVGTGFQGSDPLPPGSCGTAQSLPQPPPTLPFGGSLLGSGQNIAVLPMPLAGSVSLIARSTWFDTGYGTPVYANATPADEQFTLGDVPGGSVVIRYQGAPEDAQNPGTPASDQGLLSPWVTGGQLTNLSGYRFVRFEVAINYAPPPTSTITNSYPAVQQITINFSAPIGCPP